MDKDRKEALQVAKELTAKFIETRTVSPGNFASTGWSTKPFATARMKPTGRGRERLSHFPIRPGFRSVPRP